MTVKWSPDILKILRNVFLSVRGGFEDSEDALAAEPP